MTKNQFMALKPGDKIKCKCGHCNGLIWTMKSRYGAGWVVISAMDHIGRATSLLNDDTLERVE